MIDTSELYKQILSEDHTIETRLVIGESGLLITDDGYNIVFGTGTNATRILVEQGGADDGWTESVIFELKTYHSLFDGNTPTVGCTVAGQIDVSFMAGDSIIPRMAQMIPYIRLVSADGTQHSEWIRKGAYFIDTREVTHNDDGLEVLHLTGYDALLKTQADYPSDRAANYPATDTVIVQKIAKAIGVDVDPRTWDIMTGGFTYGLPVSYSMQEVLSSIAIPYAGNWIMTDDGLLRLVSFADVPKETRLLTDEIGYVLVFGSGNNAVRILV